MSDESLQDQIGSEIAPGVTLDGVGQVGENDWDAVKNGPHFVIYLKPRGDDGSIKVGMLIGNGMDQPLDDDQWDSIMYVLRQF